ncbi:hypothetical protein [Ewingella americana]
MNKTRLFKASLLLTSLVMPLAYADWATRVEDDVFTGGHTAIMIGLLGSSETALLFDCSKGKLDIAYVEQDKTTGDIDGLPVDLVVKIDGNPVIKLDATLSRRNANSLQAKSTDAESITSILKFLQNAKSKVLVGLQAQDGTNQQSFTGNASGSTASVNNFIKACEVKL